MNKVDLVEDKKNLLKVAKEFEDLPGYERQLSILLGLDVAGNCSIFSLDISHFFQVFYDIWIKWFWCQRPYPISDGSGILYL